MGSYSGSLSNSANSIIYPFLVLNNSKNDGRYLAPNNSLRNFEIKYNSSSNVSTFVLNSVDKTKHSYYQTLYSPFSYSLLMFGFVTR